jgi:hypothetical protein
MDDIHREPSDSNTLTSWPTKSMKTSAFRAAIRTAKRFRFSTPTAQNRESSAAAWAHVMETAIERFVVLSYLVIGLSHILQPRAWVRFFVIFREKGDAGIFIVAFLHLTLGALIVSFHNVWTGIPAVVIVTGQMC